MHGLFLTCLLTVPALGPSPGPSPGPPPGRPVVAAPLAGRMALLPPDKGPRMASPCSRRRVEGVTGTWTPSRESLAQLESRLASWLFKHHRREYARLSTTLIQVAGLRVGSRRILYLNAFPECMAWEPEDGPGRRDIWKQEPIRVCDGGPSCWGVVYDPDSGTFEGMAFNGTA